LSALRFCESVEKTHSNHDTSALVAAELGITAPPLRIDSQCKYAVLARGDAEVYLRLPAKAKSTYVEFIWDHAAGELSTPSKPQHHAHSQTDEGFSNSRTMPRFRCP
jgi:3'-phosphoadenosine 5'-phosphosulfate (PAPS) 3'-phosphatase